MEKGKKNRKKQADGAPSKRRPTIGVFWECCKVYSRISLNKKGTAYVGWCPRCAKRVQMDVVPWGSKSRFFNVS
ncbi:MAG: hypothetical protein U9P14_06075 [Gemmatimonadota bacterium]|nr:hypothetical protein [Gemmatimonadota bacterium]